MKLLIRRWLDDPGFNLARATDNRQLPKPIANQWSELALRRGVKLGIVILFSKKENLYSHNTTLSAKKINRVLKLSEVIQMKKGDIIIINIKHENINS